LIPDTFIQELLYRVDLVDLIDGYVPLKKTGANFAACCPFHSEKSPFFHGQPEQAVLPLLRLQRARQCNQLSYGVRRPGLR
jgi:DNA primase